VQPGLLRAAPPTHPLGFGTLGVEWELENLNPAIRIKYYDNGGSSSKAKKMNRKICHAESMLLLHFCVKRSSRAICGKACRHKFTSCKIMGTYGFDEACSIDDDFSCGPSHDIDCGEQERNCVQPVYF